MLIPIQFFKASLVLFIFLNLILLTGLNKVYAEGSVTLSGQPATVNASVGETVTVNIAMDTNGDSVSAAELHLTYDGSALQGQSITAGSFLPIVLTAGTIGSGNASIILGSLPSSPASGTGTVAILSFKALKAGSSVVNIAGTSKTASLGKSGNTTGTLTGTNVNVTAATIITPSPKPISTTTPATNPKGLTGRLTVSFDDAPGKDRTLDEQYPAGLIDWGDNLWYISSPWQQFRTKSFSFNGPAGISEAAFNLIPPGHLESLQAYNGGTLPSTVTLSCPGQTARVVTVNQAVAPTTIQTGWSGSCQTITLSSSNGWDTNFDNLVLADPSTDPLVTPIPTPLVKPSPTGSGETQTITFDSDLDFKNKPLNGQYPAGIIDWGSYNWFLSAPWKQFTTKSFSFNGPKISRATFKFLVPKILVSLKAYNGGKSNSTVSLRCPGQPIKTVTVAVNQLVTIETNWNSPCPNITINSTNGWNTNFDDLIIK